MADIAIHIGTVNQLNMGGGNTYIENHGGGKPAGQYKESDSLAGMIDEARMDLYKKMFNELLAPYIVGEVVDPMEVVDMKFSRRLKKNDIYRAFNIIANYIKPGFSLPDLAYYMQCHIEGMPGEVESIVRRIR